MNLSLILLISLFPCIYTWGCPNWLIHPIDTAKGAVFGYIKEGAIGMVKGAAVEGGKAAKEAMIEAGKAAALGAATAATAPVTVPAWALVAGGSAAISVGASVGVSVGAALSNGGKIESSNFHCSNSETHVYHTHNHFDPRKYEEERLRETEMFRKKQC